MPISNLSNNYPKEKAELLKNILTNNIPVFNLEPETAYKLLIEICKERYKIKSEAKLFDEPVIVPEICDKDYLENNSILKTFQWDNFSSNIKTINRYHNEHINKKLLYRFLKCAKKIYQKNCLFYRARICKDNLGFSAKDMGAPPSKIAKAGRVNPAGISVLYLSDSIDTTLYETRSGIFDYVTVATFKLLRDIEIVDLANLDNISPFFCNNVSTEIDFKQFAINIGHLRKISQEIAKPLRNDNILDYVPTQYISDFIKSKGFDGIEYKSTLKKDGYNLAIFDEKQFECVETHIYEINTISYSYRKIK